jgi:hypothetical protein
MVLKLETVSQDIDQWIRNFVEVPHPALGGWAPCPYARKARLDQDYTVRVGVNPYFDLLNVARDGLGGKSVVILAYDPDEFFYAQFTSDVRAANQDVLVARDLLALEDHPGDPEIVNGVTMNQGTYALALVQSLSDLDQKARAMASKGFYTTWPEGYLTGLFEHRQDPRK